MSLLGIKDDGVCYLVRSQQFFDPGVTYSGPDTPDNSLIRVVDLGKEKVIVFGFWDTTLAQALVYAEDLITVKDNLTVGFFEDTILKRAQAILNRDRGVYLNGTKPKANLGIIWRGTFFAYDLKALSVTESHQFFGNRDVDYDALAGTRENCQKHGYEFLDEVLKTSLIYSWGEGPLYPLYRINDKDYRLECLSEPQGQWKEIKP
jgi:hypothetical protein